MSNLPRQTKTQTYHINNLLFICQQAALIWYKRLILGFDFTKIFHEGYNWMGFILFHMQRIAFQELCEILELFQANVIPLDAPEQFHPPLSLCMQQYRDSGNTESL